MTGPVTKSWIIAALMLLNGAALCAQQAEGEVPDRNDTVYLLSYDHGGLILWGADHFRERLENGISWLDKYPGFKIGLDNEAHIYDYFSVHEPELLEEIAGYLDKYRGRFGIGTCTYGQPLSQFINEESNIRQIAYSLKATRTHFNYRPPVYLMSEHAMHSQMPQILSGFGFDGAIMRTHYMMYGYNPVFDVPIGWWTGVDGSRIAAIPTYKGEGAEFGKTPVDNWILTRYPGPECSDSLEQFREQFAHIRPLLASRADDSGLRQEGLVAKYEGNPMFRWILLDELLGKYPEPEAVMYTGPDDFTVRMPWGYCGNEIWNGCRKAEVQVLTAERLAALEYVNGGSDRETELDLAWQDLLLAQHHDVQIVGLLPEAHALLPASLGHSSEVLEASLEYLAAGMEGEGVRQVTVFNPHSWPVYRWITTTIALPRGEARGFLIKSGDDVLPSRVIRAYRYSDQSILEGQVFFRAELPPLSVVSFSVIPLKDEPEPAGPGIVVDQDDLRITTAYLDIGLARDGGIDYIKDVQGDRFVSSEGRKACYFEGTIDGQKEWSAGRWVIRQDAVNAPFVTAREYGFIAGIPYTFEIRVYEDSPVVECSARFDFNGQKIGLLSDNLRDSYSPFIHEEKLRFKFFPGAGPEATGIRDLPFIIAETDNKYVEGNYWIAISDGKHGLAFFNRGTMGSIREDDGSFSIPLAYSMYYIWGTRMLSGSYSYEFAICPFNGDWKTAGLHKKALEYNFPIPCTEGGPGSGRLGSRVDLLQADADNVILSALYSSHGRIFARFYEYWGNEAAVSIDTGKKGYGLTEVDLDGNIKGAVPGTITFLPHRIRTFLVR